MKISCVTLFLVIINCFSFAQKKDVYIGGACTMTFYDDNTFLYKVYDFCKGTIFFIKNK